MHSEKISALGRVAAQVAHEVKNPLAGLRLYSLHLKNKVSGKLSDGEMDIVNKIADGIGRLTETTEQILSFARPINMALTGVNLNRVVRDTAQLLAPQIEARKLILNLELGEPAPVGMLDEASIHAELMVCFYKQLCAGVSSAKALRHAQLEVMKGHPHPFFWSLFALFGRW